MQKDCLSLLVRGVVVAVCLALEAHVPARAAAMNDRIVVMISVDGLAAFYLDDPKAEMPTLRKLAAEGARADGMKASTPTVTWPNHTTLVTGDNPARHGVVGNNYYDRASGEKVVLIADPIYDKDQIVKVPTIYDVAKAAGMKTAAVRWPATRNAHTLDWTIPSIGPTKMAMEFSTPSLLEECERANIDVFGKKIVLAGGHTEPRDDSFTSVFNLILREHRPQLALLHVSNVDYIQHKEGPRSAAAYEAIKQADHQVQEVWEELQKDFPGRATLIIVSDHGFSPIRKRILPAKVLAKAGLGDSPKSHADVTHVVAQGGAAFIYIENEAHREEVMAKVRKAFAGVKGVSKVVGSEDFKDYGVADPKEDPHAPDMILFAEEGYMFGDTAAGALPFSDKPESKGSHGHDASLPDLHATFVAWGAGIKPGVKLGEITNIDVAPTIAKLLGLNLPNTDGKPLTAILAE